MNTKQINKLLLVSIAVVLLITGLAHKAEAQTVETILNGTSFNSWAALEAEWNYNYPWGDTHNGSAKMYPGQLSIAGGVLTIAATTPDPESTYKYRSGTIHLKESICITEQHPEWSFSGEFQAPNTRGTWPAFWITRAGPWTHECDILEFKGTTENWFNTYDGGWETTKVRVNDSMTAWHSYRLVATRANATDVTTRFYLDGVLKGTHTLSGGMGQCFWLIINLQMEGSSGSPGPTSPTYYHARNVVVTRTVVPPPAGPPAPPTNLTATAGDTTVSLDWDDNSEWDVTHYNLYASTVAGGPYDLIAGNLTQSSYNHINLINGRIYYYVATAVDLDLNTSGISNEASATPQTLYPLSVQNFSFEQPGTVKQTNWENVPGWNSDTIASDSGVETGAGATDGLWTGFLMGTDPSVWQTTSHTIQSGEQLVLQIDGKSSYAASTFRLDLYYEGTSGQRNLLASKTVNVGESMVEYTLSASANNVPGSIGRVVGIELKNSGGGWAGFDNVRLKSSLPATVVNPPPTPTSLTATSPQKRKINLSWASSSGASSYNVKRSTTNGGPYTTIATGVTTTTYSNSGLTSGVTYYYVVSAVNSAGESPNSNQAAAVAK